MNHIAALVLTEYYENLSLSHIVDYFLPNGLQENYQRKLLLPY